MLRNLLSQFDVICIIPLWIGNNEISFTNLSFTVVFVVLIGVYFFFWLYSNQITSRSFQVILNDLFNFSIDNILLGGGRFFETIVHVDVRRLKKNINMGSLKKRVSIYDNVQDHPIVPNLVKNYDYNDFYLALSNLTTTDKNAFFLANKNILHPISNVYLYKDATIIKLDNKIVINNVIFDLNLSKTDMQLSNMFLFDNKLNDNMNLLIKKQIQLQLGDNYGFFCFDSVVENKFESFKNILD